MWPHTHGIDIESETNELKLCKVEEVELSWKWIFVICPLMYNALALFYTRIIYVQILCQDLKSKLWRCGPVCCYPLVICGNWDRDRTTD